MHILSSLIIPASRKLEIGFVFMAQQLFFPFLKTVCVHVAAGVVSGNCGNDQIIHWQEVYSLLS